MAELLDVRLADCKELKDSKKFTP